MGLNMCFKNATNKPMIYPIMENFFQSDPIFAEYYLIRRKTGIAWASIYLQNETNEPITYQIIETFLQSDQNIVV